VTVVTRTELDPARYRPVVFLESPREGRNGLPQASHPGVKERPAGPRGWPLDAKLGSRALRGNEVEYRSGPPADHNQLPVLPGCGLDTAGWIG